MLLFPVSNVGTAKGSCKYKFLLVNHRVQEKRYLKESGNSLVHFILFVFQGKAIITSLPCDVENGRSV